MSPESKFEWRGRSGKGSCRATEGGRARIQAANGEACKISPRRAQTSSARA